ncbi:MAG: UDP-N-acetylmuramoyl-tripeptide--D-alanyl-D-alanine ligase [Candidatus Eisenbacteria bacterium]|nr:UDP-N-acetylmuramoyl-tripeptide--D-alanyl-D-alanine ligase [Candidatus Eisenbacteria bacterium]
MTDLTLARVASMCGGRLAGGQVLDRALRPGQVSIDTRRLMEGEIFVALRGDRDGHDFVSDAAARGAGGAIVEEGRPLGPLPRGFPLIVVDDTLRAMQRWAAAHRRSMPAVVIAVTGSSGKTTTKDRISEILSDAGSTHATRGNLNNQIGVPLTILGIGPGDRWAVVEVAMNHPGEIAPLARISDPDHVVITTIGWAHIGPFGTREAILSEKLEAVRAMRPGGVFFHEADPWLIERLPREIKDLPRRTFGIGEGADFRPDLVEWDLAETRFRTSYTGDVRLRCPGRGALQAALAASLLAQTFGLDGGVVRACLERARPRPLRMEPRPLGPATAILDCYNASPESSEAAVDFLSALRRGGRRWLAFGEMRELGDRTEEAHRRLGEKAAMLDGLFLLGEGCRPLAESFLRASGGARPARVYDTEEDLADDLAGRLERGDVVLFKGSRMTAMEKAYEACLTRLEREE